MVLLVFFLRGSEDRWMCDNGEWVKHGVPSAPMPDEPCPGDNINEISNNNSVNQNANSNSNDSANQNTNSLISCSEIEEEQGCQEREDCLRNDLCNCTTERYKKEKCDQELKPEDWCLCVTGGFYECIDLEC